MDIELQREIITALEYYTDAGVTNFLNDEVMDRTDLPLAVIDPDFARQGGFVNNAMLNTMSQPLAQPAFLGKSEAYGEAVKLAKAAQNLDELRDAIALFDGVAIKKTASNMVFADGNSKAHIMVIGDAPGADDDRLGKPFHGIGGQLMDKILACIDLDRTAPEPEKSVYLSNILNWRPPGNRSPSPAEIEVSLPFIERHIQLVKPKILILCGAGPSKSLLGRSESISRLRKSWHDYSPQTQNLKGLGGGVIPAIATYQPTYLLRTPAQKKSVWADMLEVKAKIITC